MLVATIAGTATFKWLSSQSSSSTARMQQNEAYQSAIAGIQEARSWMTYHGNDVGAIIRQYLTSEKKPILLNNRLSHAISDKQNFDVWLTGVSEDVNGTRKLKIISKGKARNGSVHSESAILNVSGLYQISHPVEEEKRKKINFSYAYFGSSVRNHGVTHSTSMLINGNWTGNPLDIDEDLIVTGWTRPSGSDFTITGNACFGGKLYMQNHFKANNLFIDDEISYENNSQGGPFIVTGNAYFNKNISQGKNGFNIGNMTVANTVNTHQEISDASFNVNGDLCLKENGQIYIGGSQGTSFFGGQTFGGTFSVGGNVWIDPNNNNPFYNNGGDFSDKYSQIFLGTSPDSKLYTADAHPYSDYEKLRKEKTFKEKKEWNKVCINPVEIGEGNNKTGGCEESKWTKWNNEEYSPYVSIPKKDKMFYFYHEEKGVTDVDFINQKSSYWKIRKAQNPGIPFGPIPTGGGFSNWEPAEMASYYVGGNLFKDNVFDNPTEYNYGNNVSKKRSPYCKQIDGTSPKESKDASFRPECHVTPWFKSNGQVDAKNYKKPPITCADTIKKYCDEIWEEKEGCDGAKYKIDDILVTAISKFEPFANKGCAKNITSWTNDFGNKLNSCYSENISDSTKKGQNLYNGYLVVKVRTGSKTDPTTELNGKFIIILDNDPQEMFSLPPTKESNSYVFLYMKEGASRGIEITPAVRGRTYNYFIYTPKNVGVSMVTNPTWNPWNNSYSPPEINTQGGFLFGTTNFNGTIYAAAKNCAKISAITAANLSFNADLMNSLTDSGVLCSAEIPEEQCGGVGKKSSPVTPGSGGSSSSSAPTTDPDEMEYFISIAPQLNVTLESQYKSIESTPEEDTVVTPSIVVLPRIIYLPKDAKGTLSDYYSVVNLNGANENKSPSKVSCPGSIPTTGKLYQNNQNLEMGTFTCTYTSNQYGSIPFYVIVNDASSEAPAVEFNKAEQELQLENEVDINVSIPKYAGPELEFSIALTTDLPDGVEIVPQPGVTARESSGGYKAYYSIKTSALANGNKTFTALKVKASDEAGNANLMFILTTPLKNCLIGHQSTHIVKLKGYITINRDDLRSYCERYPTICAEKGYNAKVSYLNCDLNEEGTRWVKAIGASCKDSTLNQNWTCKTTKSVNLEAVYNSLPQQCEIIIPEEENTITNPIGGESYNLYAAIKRKKVNLTVNFNQAEDKFTKIKIYDELNNEATDFPTCTVDQKECTFKVYAGATIHLYHEEGSSDNGSFSNWSCVGDNCPNEGAGSSADELILPSLFSNHTITANYRKDDHCFYEDFKNMKVFCNGTSSDNEEGTCLDTCARQLKKDEMCEVKNTKQAKSKWLVMYKTFDKNEYIKPITDNNKGSIMANNSKNAENNSGRNTQILSTVTAGQYGTLTAMIQTHAIQSDQDNDFLNSGFIIRSSGKEYLIVNIFGADSDKKKGNVILKARVCKGDGQSINNYKSGQCEIVKSINNSERLPFNETDFIKVALTLDDNNFLTVKAVIGDKSWTGGLDIKPFGLNSDLNTYVGFGLADASFKLYDFGWTSTSFNEDCWDIPTVSCSFADAYIGGTIPQNEDASPKVIISSWFTEKNCRAEYFYNGCDNETSEAKNCGSNSDGRPGELGSPLNNTLGIYQFSKAGTHGYMVDQKKTMDAQIKVTCPGDETSLDLAKEYYSCGTFIVGDIEYCSEENELYNRSVTLSADESTEIDFEPSTMNLRGSKLRFHIDEKQGINKLNLDPDNQALQLTIKLKSSNGMISLPTTISQKGITEINVDNISNTSGFNPQEVTGVIITSNGFFYAEQLLIDNDCPYKLKVHCNKADFDIGKGKWKVEAGATGADVTCSLKSDNSNIENLEKLTECNGPFYPEFLSNIFNTIGSTDNFQPTFTFNATDSKGKSGSCTVTANKLPEESLSCEIPKDKIKEGERAPTFTFTLNTLLKQADYTITLDNDIVKQGSAETKIKQNYTDDKKLAPGTHTYEIRSQNKSCSKEFTVEAKDKSIPQITSCSVDGNGKFTAVISNPDNVKYSYKAMVGTKPNNIAQTTKLDETDPTTTSDKSLSYTYKNSKTGSYTYRWEITYNNEVVSTCNQDLEITSLLKAECAANGVNDNDRITIEAKITNCAEPCHIDIIDINGDIYKMGYNATESSNIYTFWDNNAKGTRTYKLTVKDGDDNKTSCNFKVSFEDEVKSSSSSRMSSSSAKVKDYRIDKYDDYWENLSPGTYNITCDGNPYGGRLVCKCVNNNWQAPNCDVEYEGFNIEIRASEDSGGKEVSREDRPCRNGQGGTLKVFSDVQCKHAW